MEGKIIVKRKPYSDFVKDARAIPRSLITIINLLDASICQKCNKRLTNAHIREYHNKDWEDVNDVLMQLFTLTERADRVKNSGENYKKAIEEMNSFAKRKDIYIKDIIHDLRAPEFKLINPLCL